MTTRQVVENSSIFATMATPGRGDARLWRWTVGEWLGVSIAIASSLLGKITAAVVTRLWWQRGSAGRGALLRWGIGVPCVLLVALLMRARWPGRQDWLYGRWPGFPFYGLFTILCR